MHTRIGICLLLVAVLFGTAACAPDVPLGERVVLPTSLLSAGPYELVMDQTSDRLRQKIDCTEAGTVPPFTVTTQWRMRDGSAPSTSFGTAGGVCDPSRTLMNWDTVGTFEALKTTEVFTMTLEVGNEKDSVVLRFGSDKGVYRQP